MGRTSRPRGERALATAGARSGGCGRGVRLRRHFATTSNSQLRIWPSRACWPVATAPTSGAARRDARRFRSCVTADAMSKRRRDESSAAPDAGVVRLNVGGTIYTTTLDTLRAVPDSLFGRMFDPDISLGMVPTDEDGNIFFDRDPEVFRWVLDFLRRRGRSVGMPRRELRPLLRDEADYFGLVGLVEACDADQAPEPIVTILHEGFAGVITTVSVGLKTGSGPILRSPSRRSCPESRQASMACPIARRSTIPRT